MEPDLLLKVIRDLYDAVLSPDLGADRNAEGFMSLCRLVAGQRLIFFTEDVYQRRLQFVTGLGVGPDYFRRLAMATEANILPPGLLVMPSGATKLGRSLSPGRRMEETQFYNEVVRPDGAIDGLVSVPFRHGRFFACLAIERIRGQPDFEESDARIIQFVLPHLTNATRIRLRLEQAELTTGLAYRAFDQLDLGVFVVDAELRPLHVNKFAEALLKEADGLSISQGKLKAMDLDRMRALQRAVKAAFALYDIRPLRQPSYDEIVNLAAPFELTRRTNSPTLTATVVPLSGENAQRFLAPPSRAVLFVKRSTDAPRADVGELQVRLGLSPRQAALTALLAQGMTLARAAESLGVATETARWHLREAFQKTYTHRQADLVRLALSGGKPAIDD